ncbi:hypothetical protein J6590_006880 [Homalodisca vitripennis]|nr:hypothetical protein J6590_006880 [Homalodisca vitripennis]
MARGDVRPQALFTWLQNKQAVRFPKLARPSGVRKLFIHVKLVYKKTKVNGVAVAVHRYDGVCNDCAGLPARAPRRAMLPYSRLGSALLIAAPRVHWP